MPVYFSYQPLSADILYYLFYLLKYHIKKTKYILNNIPNSHSPMVSLKSIQSQVHICNNPNHPPFHGQPILWF